jgi:hypothetical protein
VKLKQKGAYFVVPDEIEKRKEPLVAGNGISVCAAGSSKAILPVWLEKKWILEINPGVLSGGKKSLCHSC